MSHSNLSDLPWYDHRPGTGPALVFLHYWGGSSRTWASVIDRLPGREVVTIDSRGWSRSRELRGPYTLQQVANDALAVIADAGIGEYVLVGHSMGGKAAQLIGASRRSGLRGLVLVAPAPAKPSPRINPEYQQMLSHAYDNSESRAFARDNILTAATLSAEHKAQVAQDSGASHDEARTEWPLHGIADDVSDAAARIDVPTLVVAGAHDQVEPVDVLKRNLLPHLSNARLSVIPGSGHLLPLEAPQHVADEIVGFLSSLTGADTTAAH